MNASRSRFNPWPWGIIVAFVVFLGGTAALIVIAGRDPNVLVAPDYYEQELGYQKRVDQLKRTLPWAAQISVRHAPEVREIQIEVPREHVALGLHGQVVLYRPARSGQDRTFNLAPDNAGHQSIPSTELAAGFWKARLSWTAGTNEFFADRDFVVPSSVESNPASAGSVPATPSQP